MTAEENKLLDDFTKKFASELCAFEEAHGYISGGFAVGLFRKISTEYAKHAYNQGVRDAADKYVPDGNPKKFRDEILKLLKP